MRIFTRKPKHPTTFLSLFSILLLLGSLAGFIQPVSDVSAAEIATRRLPAPSPTAPADGAVVKGVQFTQSWSEIIGAKYYLYESYNNRQATDLRAQQRVPKATKTIAHVPSGTFWWRVRAVNEHDKPGRWSKLQRVTTDSEAPTIRPLLTIGDAPVQGAVRFIFESVDKNPWRITSGVFSEVPPGGMPIGNPGNNVVETTDVTVIAKVTLNINTLTMPNGPKTIIVNVEDRAGNIQERRFYFTVANSVAPAPEAPLPPAPPVTGTTESAVAPVTSATAHHATAASSSSTPRTTEGGVLNAHTDETAPAPTKVLSMQTERGSIASATNLDKARSADSIWYWIPTVVILGVAGLWGATRLIRNKIS